MLAQLAELRPFEPTRRGMHEEMTSATVLGIIVFDCGAPHGPGPAGRSASQPAAGRPHRSDRARRPAGRPARCPRGRGDHPRQHHRRGQPGPPGRPGGRPARERAGADRRPPMRLRPRCHPVRHAGGGHGRSRRDRRGRRRIRLDRALARGQAQEPVPDAALHRPRSGRFRRRRRLANGGRLRGAGTPPRHHARPAGQLRAALLPESRDRAGRAPLRRRDRAPEDGRAPKPATSIPSRPRSTTSPRSRRWCRPTVHSPAATPAPCRTVRPWP